MNTFFIRIFFSIFSLYIFLYILSFAFFEIQKNKNFFGSIFTILITLGSIIFSNIIFWLN